MHCITQLITPSTYSTLTQSITYDDRLVSTGRKPDHYLSIVHSEKRVVGGKDVETGDFTRIIIGLQGSDRWCDITMDEVRQNIKGTKVRKYFSFQVNKGQLLQMIQNLTKIANEMKGE